MNVLILLDRVPDPEECARTSIDTNWLVDLAAIHDVVVAVDEASPGLSRLREEGVTVHVSDKRHVYLPGGRLADADEAFASWVASKHAERPFDLVVASPERPLLGQVRSALSGLPWAVLAAAGPCAATPRLCVDQNWLRNNGSELWFAASNVAAADVVVSPVAPAALGLETPRQAVATLLPTPEPDLRRHVAGELVVVAATGVSRADAAWTLELALDVIDVRRSTTIIVVHAPAMTGAEDLGPALAAGIPDHLEQQVVLVPADREGDAGAWVTTADAMVLADTAELLVPTVARRAALVPTALLGADPNGAARTTKLLTAPPQVADGAAVRLLQWSNPTRTAAELRAMRATKEVEMVVLHDEVGVTEATRWLRLEGLGRFDVVLGAAERLPWGMPHLDRLDGSVVALHRRTWSAIGRELDGGRPLNGLVADLADLAGARSHALGIVPVEHELQHWVEPSRAAHALELLGGPLRELRLRPPPAPAPAPARAPARTQDGRSASSSHAKATVQAWARRTRWTGRARLALPWQFGLADAIEEGAFPDAVAGWARRHRIIDRARLLLPWRWGLLPRAMEDHW